MPKSSGGGTSGSKIFTTNISGDGVLGSSAYISLGTIPTNSRVWFGSLQAASPDKSIAFEIRTSNTGESQGTDSKTAVLSSVSVSPRNGLVTQDLYKNGRLHLVSVIGTGTEYFWIKLKTKSTSAGSYFYSLNYTLE